MTVNKVHIAVAASRCDPPVCSCCACHCQEVDLLGRTCCGPLRKETWFRIKKKHMRIFRYSLLVMMDITQEVEGSKWQRVDDRAQKTENRNRYTICHTG